MKALCKLTLIFFTLNMIIAGGCRARKHYWPEGKSVESKASVRSDTTNRNKGVSSGTSVRITVSKTE